MEDCPAAKLELLNVVMSLVLFLDTLVYGLEL